MKSNAPSISVIIPCHNNQHFLGLALEALLNQSSKAEEIICVNDASKESSYRSIRTLCRMYKARLVSLPSSSSGFGRRSHARNLGTTEARGDVLLYLDGDMLLGPRYIETIRHLHFQDHEAMVKGIRFSIPQHEQLRGSSYIFSKILSNDAAELVIQDQYRVSRRTTKTNEFAALSSLFWANTSLSRRGFLITLSAAALTMNDIFITSKNEVIYSDKWDYCASNNLSVRKKNVIRIGGWDENFIGWGEEDIDFAYRLFQMGCRPVLPNQGDIYAYHLDHLIEFDTNLHTLERNAKYFTTKFPIMRKLRQDVYANYDLKL